MAQVRTVQAARSAGFQNEMAQWGAVAFDAAMAPAGFYDENGTASLCAPPSAAATGPASTLPPQDSLHVLVLV